jgi:hypothetical protein
MNKKLLFLILLTVVVVPVFCLAVNDTETIMANTKKLVINIGMAIVVIGWVISGILYLMAAGAPEKIKIAKQAMIASIIGTVLVAIAALGYDAIKGLLDPILGTTGTTGGQQQQQQQTKKPNGQSCFTNSECQSGNCAGVCF